MLVFFRSLEILQNMRPIKMQSSLTHSLSLVCDFDGWLSDIDGSLKRKTITRKSKKFKAKLFTQNTEQESSKSCAEFVVGKTNEPEVGDNPLKEVTLAMHNMVSERQLIIPKWSQVMLIFM